MDAIFGIVLLAAIVSSMQWLSRLSELERYRKIKTWEFTVPVGILTLVGLTGLVMVFVK